MRENNYPENPKLHTVIFRELKSLFASAAS
jgi:hypothetical protein